MGWWGLPFSRLTASQAVGDREWEVPGSRKAFLGIRPWKLLDQSLLLGEEGAYSGATLASLGTCFQEWLARC